MIKVPAATRIGDNDTGHDACPPTALVGASPDVFVNGKALGRIGDPYAPHGCIVHPAHTAHIASGSSTVFINGIPAGRIGDSIDCGGSVAEGSPNVFIGG